MSVIRFMLLAVAAASSAAVARGQAVSAEPPSANPARPTVTNPATLPPVGYLQFEQGYLGSLGSPETATQYGANQVIKLAVNPRLMFAVGYQPLAVSTEYGVTGSSRDAGAVQVGLQAVLFTPSATPPPAKVSTDGAQDQAQKSTVPTVSLGYSHTVYAGTAPDIDLGSATNTALLLFSGDLGNFHYDANVIANEQDGDSNVGNHRIRRAQFAQTLSVNHSVFSPNLQFAVEVYHFSQPLVNSTSDGTAVERSNLFDLLIASSYQVRPNLVIDCGFTHGFTSTSTQWQSFAGFTYLLPKRLWPEKK